MDLEEALQLYGDYCLRIAYIYTKDRQAAEEIIQDVFLQYEPDSFREEASLKTYLVKITINKCHDYTRKLSRRTKIFLEKYLPLAKENLSGEDFYHLEFSEVTQEVLKLPIHYREIILFYYYEELKITEIAKLLNLSENTVKTRHMRAKKALKKSLTEVNFNDEME